MKRLFLLFPVMISLLALGGCKKVVETFKLDVGDNAVTVTGAFSKDFAFNFSNSYDIVVKGVQYGTITAIAPTESQPFQVAITANFDMFTSDVWEGFASTKTLPNGDPLPAWINPNELVRVDIPNFTEQIDLVLYVGYKKPYYVGVALTLKVLDNRYPDGLTLSQYLKKSNAIWGSATVFGPSYDDVGNVTQHGGIFFVAGFNPEKKGSVNIKKFKKEDFELKLK